MIGGSKATSLTVVLCALIGLISPAIPAEADDNTSPIHWHTRPVTYRISTTFPTSWRDQVHKAANEWTNRTRMDFAHGGLINSTDWTPTDTHIVWRGGIPQTWRSGCPPETTLACTSTRRLSTAPNHIVDNDTVFNSQHEMGINSFNCEVFGVFTIDVNTVALHEFGHWGRLVHTADAQAVMFSSYVTCRRFLHQHDLDSMAAQYRGHP